VLRRKTTVEKSARAPSWQLFEGEYDGHLIYARFNTAVYRAADRDSYGMQIGVAIPLLDPDERGMPQASELEPLALIEEEVVDAAGERAVLVGVITTQSMREFVLYARSADWVESFHHFLQGRIEGHEVQVMARHDPEWGVYRTFVE
jgi:hypothetical protein